MFRDITKYEDMEDDQKEQNDSKEEKNNSPNEGGGEESSDSDEEGKEVESQSEDETAQEEIEIEELFGKIYGIERVLLYNEDDTLKDVIEKISLVPECKLMYVDMKNGQPQIKNLISLSDIFSYIGSPN